MIRFVTALVAALAATLGIANAQSDLVKRGDYLVNGILTCGNCHSPKGPHRRHRRQGCSPAGCPGTSRRSR